jgi:hypothetical protein
MLSRSADFLDGFSCFSMGGRLPDASGAIGATFAGGAFFTSGLDTFFLDAFVFFVLSMGSLGIFLA